MTKAFKWLMKLALMLLISCTQEHEPDPDQTKVSSPSVIVLGNVQDGGSPHIGCTKSCCINLLKNPDPNRMVVSLGIVDPETKQSWLIEATPDMPRQLKILNDMLPFEGEHTTNGIFLTHAHLGHYTGLMYLGREALGASQVPIYAMPEMQSFLSAHAPWSQLVNLENISIKPIKADSLITLSNNIKIKPIIVPHRDELSETVGYEVIGPEKTLLFIPDINKWHIWQKDIKAEINSVDYALLDAAFYDAKEIGYRDIAEIPHPFVTESMELFDTLPEKEKNKIYFIHINHTNPLLDTNSEAYQTVVSKGYHVAEPFNVIPI